MFYHKQKSLSLLSRTEFFVWAQDDVTTLVVIILNLPLKEELHVYTVYVSPDKSKRGNRLFLDYQRRDVILGPHKEVCP